MGFFGRREEARQRRRERVVANAIQRQARRATGDQRKVLQALLADEEAFEQAVLSVTERAPDDGTDGDRPLMNLLTWFLENWESIFALIQTVIGLFGGGGAFSLPQTTPTGEGEFGTEEA